MTVHLPDLFAKLSAYRFAAKIMCNGFIEVCNRCKANAQRRGMEK